MEKGEGVRGSGHGEERVQLSTGVVGMSWSIVAQGVSGSGQVGPRLCWGRCSTLSLLVPQGVDEGPDGLRLISDIIHEKLGIEMSVLMGANIASEVAEEKFCETTIGKEPTPHLVSSLHF